MTKTLSVVLSILFLTGVFFTSSTVKAAASDDPPTRIPVYDGINYDWKYKDTITGSNIIHTTLEEYLTPVLSGGIGSAVGRYIPTSFFRNIAKTIAIKVGIDIGNDIVEQRVWTKTKRYYDYDAYNVYVKYVVYVYSNSSRTNLIDTYYEIHKY